MAYQADQQLYLFTSLTAGSSHIITATSRLETILKANKIQFRAIDCATDEKARMLWGRRSRGRKLPGLVKDGSVIGDLDQIEEWNEYGELKDQIKAMSDGGAPIPRASRPPTVNTTSTLHPEPITSPPPRSNPSSRASSQGRHISISEPTAEEKKRDPSPAPVSDTKPKSPSVQSPQNIMMAQLGMEAAAKAKDRKASATKAAAAPTDAPTASSTARTPTPAATKAQEVTPPSEGPEMTAGKTPAMLAAEGKTRATVDKIDENTSSPVSGSPTAPRSESGDEEKSTEAQLLELRGTSTQTRQPSRLSVSTPVEKSEQILGGESAEVKEEPESSSAMKPEQMAEHVGGTSKAEGKRTSSSSTASIPSSPSRASIPERRRSHRGSNLEDADKEAIRQAEANLRIQEEEEDDDDQRDGPVDIMAAKTETSHIEKNESLESIDEKEERVLKRSSVGIGKDVGSDEMVADEPEDVDGANKKAKVIDEEKEEVQKEAGVELPSGKERDIEGETVMKPQETRAAEMEDASKSVGD